MALSLLSVEVLGGGRGKGLSAAGGLLGGRRGGGQGGTGIHIPKGRRGKEAIGWGAKDRLKKNRKELRRNLIFPPASYAPASFLPR